MISTGFILPCHWNIRVVLSKWHYLELLFTWERNRQRLVMIEANIKYIPYSDASDNKACNSIGCMRSMIISLAYANILIEDDTFGRLTDPKPLRLWFVKLGIRCEDWIGRKRGSTIILNSRGGKEYACCKSLACEIDTERIQLSLIYRDIPKTKTKQIMSKAMGSQNNTWEPSGTYEELYHNLSHGSKLSYPHKSKHCATSMTIRFVALLSIKSCLT